MKSIRLVGLVLVLSVLSCVTVHALVIETVDSDGDVGDYSSIALDVISDN